MIMKYKRYVGKVEYDKNARIFHGSIVGIKDVITFQGTHVDDLEKALKDSVDDYLDWCKETGREPQRPFSGNLRIRITPVLHAKLNKEASIQGVSLNSLIAEKLGKSI